ncbi:organic hydroperoxide resistance protein [Agitococcus lubricus]|nr:organic hydroperoxide resistance protein [Agitococcus lubricus]
MSLDKVLYQATATATGGRDGRAVTRDGMVDLRLTTPKELGGFGGDGVNPEQLFACGYSACFLGAMKFVAMRDKLAMPSNSQVTGTVGIGPIATGFGLEVALTIYVPNMPLEQAQLLVERAHQVCPYSNATRQNIDVRLHVITDQALLSI